jgi:hypothetical protein
MANFQTVNVYQSNTYLGVSSIIAADEASVIPGNLTYIRIGGDLPLGETAYRVYFEGAPSFLTDVAGINAISGWQRVNEYRRILQEDGTILLQYTGFRSGSSIRVNPLAVARVYTSGIGYEPNGVDTVDCFKVHLTDGSTFITDADGIDLIDSYAP